jgi:type IV secretion system protein VirD4
MSVPASIVPERPFWGHRLLAAFAILLSANMASTQFVAARLHYHPALGRPLIGPIFRPWAWLAWKTRFESAAPSVFRQLHLLQSAGVAGVLLLLLAASVSGIRRAKRHEGVHGTAHWATRKEIERTGLLSVNGAAAQGVYVGAWREAHSTARRPGRLYYLRHNGPEHVLALAPTRSGKGVGLVAPTLLSWPQSVVVNDQKAELWHLTAGWRAAHGGNAVLRFDPGSAEGSARFNPLEEIRLGTLHEVGDVQNLVTILVDPEGKGLVDHWAKTAHAFLTGAVLHVLYAKKAEGKAGALPDIALALSDPAQEIEALYLDMLANSHCNGKPHPVVAAAARDMLNRPEEERGSVLSTAISFLSLYRDPLIAKNVSESDFKIADLMNNQKPVTLYLVVRAEDKDRMRPLMRLIINQLVRVLLRPEITYRRGRPVRPHRHRLLLMLDEFPSYGKLEVFHEALAYIAGYGIKAYLIAQDIAQLWGAYGRDESIVSNCHIRIAYAPNKIETAEWLSRMAGTATIVKEDITQSGGRFSVLLKTVSKTFHQVSRPLATADEILRLKAPLKSKGDIITEPGDMLVFVAGHAPIFGTQSLYFRDPVFLARASLPPPAGNTPIGAAAFPKFKL